MKTKTDNTPSQDSIKPGETIRLSTRFGHTSRGKCWGKVFPGKTAPTGDFDWVDKSEGTLFLTQPGYYIIGSDDGFSRKGRAEFTLTAETETSTESAK